MKQQLSTMLDLQEEMNRKVHPNWRQQGFQWHRAIWIECAELMEHYGWKWWKKHSPDRAQVVLELIDIWHFGLSQLLQESENRELTLDYLAAQFQCQPPGAEFLRSVEDFAGEVLTKRSFDMPSFVRLMAAADLHFDELYRGYIGKNVLNFFRQDHGYKEGSYSKMWAGKEDNEHLTEVVANLDVGSVTFQKDVYAALAERYTGSPSAQT